MTKSIANIDILTDTWENLIIRLNQIATVISQDSLTANTTYANTGNTSAPRSAQLFGSFGANTVVATGSLRGGNISSSANLTISSNALFTGNTLSVSSNASFTNTVTFSANVSIAGLKANGSIGTNGQILISNGSVAYWAAPTVSGGTVTSVSGANGIGGSVTSSGSLYIVANSGIVANSSGLFVNSAYLATGTSNNALFLNGSNSSFYTNASNMVTGTLDTARLPATANISTTINVGANVTINTSAFKVGNSSANLVANSTSITLGLVSINSTAVVANVGSFSNNIAVGSNVSINTSTINIGNSTVNTIANSSLFRAIDTSGSANLTPSGFISGISVINSTAIAVGSNSYMNSTWIAANSGAFTNTVSIGNVSITSSSIFAGNTTANLNANGTILRISNSTFSANLTPLSLNIDTSVVNSSSVATNSGIFGVSVVIGANLAINTSSFSLGNSTANAIINSTAISISNSSSTANIGPASITIGSSIVNSSMMASDSATFDNINVGANVNISTSKINIGNSSINSVSNSTIFSIANSTVSSNVGPGSIVVGSVNINTTAISGPSGTFSNSVKVGANVTLNTSVLTIGNSSVNASLNSTAFSGTTNNALYLEGSNTAFFTNVENMSAGLMPTARLGTGTANASTVLLGNNTWAGAVLPMAAASINGRTSAGSCVIYSNKGFGIASADRAAQGIYTVTLEANTVPNTAIILISSRSLNADLSTSTYNKAMTYEPVTMPTNPAYLGAINIYFQLGSASDTTQRKDPETFSLIIL